jgi:putative ABC transport system permease protein
MDRGTIVVDVSDARVALDMNDAAGELLGYFSEGAYDDLKAVECAGRFNASGRGDDDEFAPVMLTLAQQNGLGEMLAYVARMRKIFVIAFMIAMSLVLWNSGLISGLRRYGEIGLRLAIGEGHGHVYGSLVLEAVVVGLAGSVLGTALGLVAAYVLQTKGIDVGGSLKNAAIMMPNVFRARITPEAFFVGFVPGLLATTLGATLAGLGVYRRSTAQLFKELEV